MTYNFNINPYYDDFEEEKGFHKILFKPGYAVQARELTQIQSQLQNQITKFGQHIFKDGSIVLGGNSFFYDIKYILVSRNNELTNFENQEFIGQTSGAKGKVVKVVAVDENTTKVYFNYTNGIGFLSNEVIVCDNQNTETIIDSEEYSGTGTAFSIEDSVFFVNGFFVFCNSQTTIIAEDELANCRVGLVTTESIVNSNQDTSLLDPALGSYNYSAPGADRYSISLDLFSFAYDPSLSSIEDNASEGFIELSRFVNGEQVSVNRIPIYSEIENTFARRTYDESGDYTVKAFGLKVKDNLYGNTNLLTLQIDPGKAYIKGYEFETISPTYIDLTKSRETFSEDGFPIFTNYGKYFYIESISGDLDYTGNKTVFLNNDTDFSNSAIGNARVKYIEYDSTDGIKQVYKIYVDNVNIFDTTNVSISDVRSMNIATFRANVAMNSYSSIVEIEGNDNESYILEIPKNYVKTLLIDGGDTTYSTMKKMNNADFASNGSVATATVQNAISNQNFLGSGTLSESDTRNIIIATVLTSTNTTFLPVGTVLDYDLHGFRVEVIDEQNLTLSATSPHSFTAAVFAKIAISDAVQKTKTLNSGTITISGTSLTVANLSSKISLGRADCIGLVSVIANDTDSNQYDYTSAYSFDTGQTDVLYDHGFIQLKPGYVDPISDNIANLQSVVVTYEYYSHSSTAGFFSVDSYPSYDSVPKYTSSTGKTFDLKNCFDFRPKRDDNATTITGTLISEPSSTIFCDFEHYIGRYDKLVLTKERKFSLVQGISSINPAIPVDLSDAMTLYVLNIPPYTKDASEVSFIYVDNRRYTMRDIGKIEKRVERMEFYTALSLLEKQAKDESIPSDVPTIDRFKNGILVDSFAGHSVGDVSNPDYRCSIDYNERYMRAPFSSYSYTFKFNSGTNHAKRGDLITLNYTTENFINQPLASDTVNLNPYNVFKWNGFLELNPSSDNWIDTTVRPDVVVNLNGENDVYTQLANTVTNPASVGVRWDDWQTIVNGVPQTTNRESTSTTVSQTGFLQTTQTTTFNTQTTTVTDQLARVGYEISTGAVQTITRDLGTKIVDVSITPFIRPRLVDYSAKALKPSTSLRALFDDVDVTQFCFPATEIVFTSNNVNQNAESIALSTNSNVTAKIIMRKRDRIFVREQGGVFAQSNVVNWVVNGSTTGTGSSTISRISRPQNVETNELGDVAGSFLIPASTFRVGERIFKLSDDPGVTATTAAATKYVAQGLSQSVERTLVSTRIATVSIDPVLETARTTSTTTSTSVVGTRTTTVDLTPPPPPQPPVPPTVACGSVTNGGRQGRFTYTLEFGSNTGNCGITYTAFSVPDRYTIIWDGNTYSSGFVGSTSYNTELNRLGFPNVSGPGSGQLLFNKTKSQPTTATLIVDAPFSSTGWRYSTVCPTGAVVLPPTKPILQPFFTVLPSYNGADICTAQGMSSVGIRFEVTSRDVPKYFRMSNVSITASSIEGTFPPGPNVALSFDTTRTAFPIDLDLDTSGDQRNARFFLFLSEQARQDLRNTVSQIPGRRYEFIVDYTATLFQDQARTIPFNGVVGQFVKRIQFNPPAIICGTATIARVDPVAQTFFVEPSVYPNGIFLDSVDLFFKKKSTTFPVTVHLRPTVNGYPSSKDVVPFSVVTLDPSEVNVSNDASVATNFKFPSPVYLPPGEHSLVALCDTTDYEIFIAKIGDFVLSNPDVRITSQPNVGSLFKSQNASTWTPFQEEDMMFRLNKCVFNTGTSNSASVILHSDFPSDGDVVYDVFFADGENLDFGATKIDYYYKTTDLNNVTDATFNRYQLGSNVTLPERRKVRSGQSSDLQMNVVLSTQDRNITPVVDLARLSSVLVQNIINNAGLSSSNFLISNYGEGYTGNANVVITSSTGSGATAIAEYKPNTGRLEIIVTNSGSGYTGDITATITKDGTATSNAEVIVQNEIGTQGGNALARYITRKVRLAPGFESMDLKAYLLANIPTSTSIKVYYKVAPETSVFFELEPWREMELESAGTFTETGFADYKYKTPGDSALPNGERFNTFAVKIVMLSSNPVKVPIIRDLRVIALDD